MSIPGRIQWREVSGSPGNWTLAGPRDTPPGSQAERLYGHLRNPSLGQGVAARETRGAAAAALFQAATLHAHEFSVNHRIHQELQTLEPQALSLLRFQPEGHGVMAVVSYMVARNGHTSVQGAALESRTHPSFRAAITSWAQGTRQHGGVYAQGPIASIQAQRRYFWGTYVPEAEPLSRTEIRSAVGPGARSRVREAVRRMSR
jgi:hypothetical protein